MARVEQDILPLDSDLPAEQLPLPDFDPQKEIRKILIQGSVPEVDWVGDVLSVDTRQAELPDLLVPKGQERFNPL